MALDFVPLHESFLVIVGNHVERYTTLRQHTLDSLKKSSISFSAFVNG